MTQPGTRRRRADPAGLVVALLLAASAGVLMWDMSRLQITSTYGVGPKAMPIVVAACLAVLAIANVVAALSDGPRGRESVDPRAILLILGGLAALIALIGFGLGFIAATAVLFATTATAFGRRAFLVDLAIGLALGIGIFLMFDKILTLSLPSGPLERLF